MARIWSFIRACWLKLPLVAAGGIFSFAEYKKATPPVELPDTLAGIWPWLLHDPNPWMAVAAIVTALGGISALRDLTGAETATKRLQITIWDRTARSFDRLFKEIRAGRDENESGHRTTQTLLTGDLDEKVIVALDAGVLTEEAGRRIFDTLKAKYGEAEAVERAEAVATAATDYAPETIALLNEGKLAEAEAQQRAILEKGQAQAWRDMAKLSAVNNVTRAIADLTRATDLDPSDFWTWIDLSRLHRQAGSLPDSRRTAERAAQHVGGDWDRMAAENELGNIARDEGNLLTANDHYLSGLALAKAVLADAPDDPNRAREVAVCHNKLGDVSEAQKDFIGARVQFEEGLAIAECLAAADPGHAGWQRDLSVGHIRLGAVAAALSDLAGARAQLEMAFAIAERLAASDPGNAEWQRDLSVSHERLGGVAMAQGELAVARVQFETSLTIREHLVAADPGHAGWQRDLSVSRNKLGDVAVAQGDLAVARVQFETSLTIREHLVAADPGHAGWQRDLSISHEKLGDVAKKAGDIAETVRRYTLSQQIAAKLARDWPDHPGFAKDLAITERELARLRAMG